MKLIFGITFLSAALAAQTYAAPFTRVLKSTRCHKTAAAVATEMAVLGIRILRNHAQPITITIHGPGQVSVGAPR